MFQNQRIVLFTLFFLLCGGKVFSQQVPIDVILIGGQSNATGQGYVKNIPDDFTPNKEVLFYYSKWLKGPGPSEQWQALSSASGGANRFGSELSLGTTLQENYPSKKFAIIKHAKSGSNLFHQWNPGANSQDSAHWGPEFKKFNRTVEAGLQKLRDKGYKPVLRAMAWQQGEADARDNAGMENSVAYGASMKHFIFRVREQFDAPEMLFVYGYVIPVPQKRFTGRDEIRTAQFNLNQSSGHPLSVKGAVLVETGDLPLRCIEPGMTMWSDKVHFNTEAMLELGNRYAKAIDQCYTNKPAQITTNVFPGKLSEWNGYTQHSFSFVGTSARLVVPEKALPENPWVWRARFPDWHTEMDRILLERGFHVAYINTNNRFGSPKAVALWDAFYEFMTEHHNLSKKVSLEGVSRGGLFVYNWAKQNPDKVNCIYAEAPVCDFVSWPGGFGEGKGSAKDWEVLKQEYGFDSDTQAKQYNNLPVDGLQKLASAKVPILHMIGLNDEIVPPKENTFELAKRYVELGGIATVIPCTQGEQKLNGHHFPIETPEVGADFVMYNTQLPKAKLVSSDYHMHRAGIRNSLQKFERGEKSRVAFLGGSITYNGGWRDSICTYLKARFSKTEFDFVAAGIPSMGTTPAAFRLDRDVLSKGKIDLLFEEAAVNDASNGRTAEEQQRAMEGIVRHVRKENPDCDVVLMHFVDPYKMKNYREGRVPEVIQNHEKIASHYKLPSLNLAKEVTERIDAGEFTWNDDFKNLHPSPFGQQVYAHSMIEFLEVAWSGGVAEDDKVTDYSLPKVLDRENYDGGALVLAENAKLAKGWEMIENWKPTDGKGTRANFTNVPMLVGKGARGVVKFSFEGTAVGMAVAAGPDAGIVEYSVDGGEWQSLDLYTRWSKHLHLPWYFTLSTGLENKKHTLKLRIADESNELSKGSTCRIRYFYVDQD